MFSSKKRTKRPSINSRELKAWLKIQLTFLSLIFRTQISLFHNSTQIGLYYLKRFETESFNTSSEKWIKRIKNPVTVFDEKSVTKSLTFLPQEPMRLLQNSCQITQFTGRILRSNFKIYEIPFITPRQGSLQKRSHFLSAN